MTTFYSFIPTYAMGIKNFQTYVETFFGKRCFEEFTVNDVCYSMKDFTRHELVKTASSSSSSSDQADNNDYYGRCGVYIDLSSYMYGRMMRSLENTETFAKMTPTLRENARDETKCVICELDRSTIERVVDDCVETLLSALGPMLLKAYRVYLAYDTIQPKAKHFEQSRRKKRCHFRLSAASRKACYERIAAKVKDYVLENHKNTLGRFANSAGAADCDAVISRPFLSAEDIDFAMGEGEWKCFYQIYRDIAQDAVDVCYVFGRDWDIGLAMTVYQHPKSPSAIKYVYGPNDMFLHTKRLDRKERMLHFVCLGLFGNDYVSGLVNLSRSNAVLMKQELDKMYSGDAGPSTYKQVKYLSRVLFDDRNPDMPSDEEEDNDDANDSDNNVEGRKNNLSRAFATVVTRLLAAVYGNAGGLHPDTVEGVLHYAGMGPFPIQPGGGKEDVLELRRYLADKRVENGENKENEDTTTTTAAGGSRGETSDESSPLTCRDAHDNQVTRTLQQCMDMFALSTLWYLSYATFYFRSPSGRTMMETATHGEDVPMIVGMRMGAEEAFSFNDVRLSRRFDLCRLLELKKILQNINCCRLYWIVEGAFAKALSSK